MDQSKLQNSVVVHIGLGKTATTSLQKFIYPMLEKNSSKIVYNCDKFVFKIESLHELSYDRTTEVGVFDELWRDWGADNKKYFFSREGLVGRDPHDWERNCAIVERIFGKDATILITVRDPESYLRSIYQQILQEGVVKKPEEFFLKDEIYLKLCRKFNPGEDIFRVDKFILQDLIEMYQRTFKRVYVVPMEEINNLKFLAKIFSLSEAKGEELRSTLKSAPKINKSYSDFAMKLTFKRESFFKKIGLRSFNYHDDNLNNFIARAYFKNLGAKSSLSMNFLTIEKEKKMQKYFNWNVLMNKVVNKIFPYKKYRMPKGVLPNQKANEDYYKIIREKSYKNGYWINDKNKVKKL